jgi:protein-L-isoaspartate(D-aspartate) O-methyltransferase
MFVPPAEQDRAYRDEPLPIGNAQTISQPYIVALMTELVRPQPTDRTLEVGTGSGYQAAVLSRLVSHVYTIEILEPLARDAEQRLKTLGYGNVTVRVGDGYAGWPEVAPFDIIVVTAAPDHVPAPLVAQLKSGGRLVIPVGSVSDAQNLLLIEKDSSGQVRTRQVAAVRFVPLRRGR